MKFDNEELAYILTSLTCMGKMLNEEARGASEDKRQSYAEKTERILLLTGKTVGMMAENNS